jgi:Zn-dependent peptidase ImmA (M78 family)
MLFRSSLKAKAGSRDQIIAAFSKKMAYTFDLLPADEQGPWWVQHFELADGSYEGAERNAATFRRVFYDDDQVSPLLSLPRLVATQMGVLLFVVSLPGIDGASAYLDGLPFIFVASRFLPRMLFTLAHEVGHLIGHHDPGQSFAVVDDEDEDELSRGSAGEEAYAHAFASSLLMPRGGIGVALKKVREIARSADNQLGDIELLYLARIFGVSFLAAARRCEDLSLLPRGGAASLNEALLKNFGSAEKRADQLKLPPRPKIEFHPVPQALLASAVDRIRAGELSIGRASSILGLSIADLLAANAPTAH